jgi:hypothetical protein
VQVSVDKTKKTATIISNDNYQATNLIIPEVVSDGHTKYRVYSIGSGAFENCEGLKGDLSIPEFSDEARKDVGIKVIGARAFYGCTNLNHTLSIGKTTDTINREAFTGCKFTDINVDEINAWYGLATNVGSAKVVVNKTGIKNCKKNYALNDIAGGLAIGQLAIPETVTAIGSNAFFGCSGLTGTLTIPNTVTTIGAGAFYNCSGFTGTLTLPTNITELGANAFDSCSGFSGSLSIPASLNNIGKYAFEDCKFSGVQIDTNNAAFALATNVGDAHVVVAESTLGSALKDYTQDDIIGSLATGVLTISTDASVTAIGENAFHGCSSLTGALTIPNNITTIDNTAFYDCSGFIGNPTFSNSLTSIGSGAFHKCSGLTGALTIPNTVVTIGARAFDECSGFNGTLSLNNTISDIGVSGFNRCSNINAIELQNFAAVPT